MSDETQAPSTPAGWYDDGTGRQRWFDGTEWGDYAPDTDEDAEPEPPALPTPPPADSDEPVVVRRTRRAPFAPPSPEPESESSLTISRNWGLGLRSANAKKESGLTRNRKIAGDLPDWSPEPPGEIAVDRHAGRPG